MEIKSTQNYNNDRLRILAIGPAGAGKTTQLRTLKGKKLLEVGGGINTFAISL